MKRSATPVRGRTPTSALPKKKDEDNETAEPSTAAAGGCSPLLLAETKRLLMSNEWGTFSGYLLEANPTPGVSSNAPSGPLVVLVHGFPDLPLMTYSPLVRELFAKTDGSVRCFLPYCRGYEPATVQKGKRWSGYTMYELATDLLDWLSFLLEQKFIDEDVGVVLVGHDWGSLIVQTAVAVLFENRHPKAVHPSRQPPYANRWHQGLKPTLLKGQVLMSVPPAACARGKLIPTLYQRWSPDMDQETARKQGELVKSYLQHYSMRCDDPNGKAKEDDKVRSNGKKVETKRLQLTLFQSVLGYYRCLVNIFNSNTRRSLMLLVRNTPILLAARGEVHMLCINGENDRCVKDPVFTTCCKNLRTSKGDGVKQHRLPGAGHWVHQEKPAEVAQIISELC